LIGSPTAAVSSHVLVTGAAGFAGSHLVDSLAAAGLRVVAWGRPGGAPPRDVPGVRWAAVDLLNRAAVNAAIGEVRPAVVYHCAGAAHVGRSWRGTADTLAINVRGTHHLLEALARLERPAHVLVPSSAMVYAAAAVPLAEEAPLGPASPYAVSKLAQEMLALRAADGGLQVHVARAFNHFGPRQDAWFVAAGFARRIADVEAGRWEPEIAVGNLEARRDLTDVRDVVRAYRLIVERGRPGRPYNVCTGQAISIRELLDRLLARARVPIRIRADPARYRPNDVPLVVGDPSRIRNEIGWTPEIRLEQALDDLLDYWRARASDTRP
jgi:GDP-4-dehydro-6-deoxy-D-mannose reductase